jgi:hypothetical protein
MSVSESGFDFDYRSYWFVLQTKLWKVLGYPGILKKIQYMWQKNLEVEIIGWPVVQQVSVPNP